MSYFQFVIKYVCVCVCVYTHVYIYGLSRWLILVVKSLTANAGDMDWFWGQEDPLKEEMSTYSIIFAWRIQWTEEQGRL